MRGPASRGRGRRSEPKNRSFNHGFHASPRMINHLRLLGLSPHGCVDWIRDFLPALFPHPWGSEQFVVKLDRL